MLGIYPIATQPVYLLASPWFPEINMTINGNSTLRIISKGSDGQSLGQKGYYVQSVTINGEKWEKNWFEHDDLMVKGGTLEFTVGSNISRWETGEVPPSPGHVVLPSDSG